MWHGSYVQTYLERDVRTLRQVENLTGFQSFLRVLAARSGQLLNLTDVARDIEVAVNTIKAWLSVLEATYQVIVLRPYFANVGKRLVKTPKVYFTDLGTLCHLAGLRDAAHAASGPLGGAIMETAVLSETVKSSLLAISIILSRGSFLFNSLPSAAESDLNPWNSSSFVLSSFSFRPDGHLVPSRLFRSHSITNAQYFR